MNRIVNGGLNQGWWTRERLMTVTLFIFTVLLLYGCYRIARPFLTTLTLAIAIAVAAFPLHRWVSRRIKAPSLAAGATLLLVIIVIVAPAFFIGQQVALEAAKGVEQIRANLTPENWEKFDREHPRLGAIVDRIEREVNLRDTLQQAAGTVSGVALSAVKGSVHGIVQLFVVFFFLFFFFRDWQGALAGLRAVLPLTDAEVDKLFTGIGDTIHAVFNGMLLVALAQGTLGGLMFWWLGLPAPILWGAVMALLSFLPMLGTGMIWVPAAVFLALQGQWIKAIILIAWGMLAIGLVDNFMYPTLVGKKIRLHTIAVFIAILGGVTLFGFAGVILGPLLFGTAYTVLQIWRERTADGESAEQAVQEKPVIVRP
jgi:predicted PurR-regulated permease PerM